MARSNCPNIIVITSDQQRTDTLACYGSAHIKTPNFDRLAQGGVLFRRAYCANPVCTPSRASIFSGQMVSHHGAFNVGTCIDDKLPLISHHLRDAGYATHSIGKAHFQPYGCAPQDSRETLANWQERFPSPTNAPYYGFDSIELAMGHTTFGVAGDYGAWVRGQLNETEFKALSTATNLAQHPFGGEAWDWQMPHALHNSVWTAERTIAWLKSHPQGDPFFLAVGFQDPHAPHALPLDFTNRVDAAAVPMPDFTAGELDDKPAYFGQVHCGEFESSCWRGEYPMAGQAASCVLDYRKVTEAEARQGRAYYYGMVQLMDAQLGRILDALDEAGLTDNTLIIFTSDHGDLLGDHGLWQKGPFHYEQMIKVPLLMRWPAGLEGQRQSSDLVSLCDIAPTVMAAAGLPVPAEMDGINTLPLLNGGSATARDQVLVECIDNPDKLRLKTIVTADAKLTRYAGVDWGELYDLKNDPREKVNLWDDPAHAPDKANLLNRLLHDLEPLERRRPRLCYA